MHRKPGSLHVCFFMYPATYGRSVPEVEVEFEEFKNVWNTVLDLV